MMEYGLIRQILKDQSLPACFVDLTAFQKNIDHAAFVVHAIDPRKKIRVASKSVRVPALIKKILQSHSIFQGVMLYSAQEIPALVAEGLDDFFIAYPTLLQSDLKLVREAHDSGKKVSLAVDSIEQLAIIAQAFQGVSQPLPLIIDIDASVQAFGLHLGVRRSPIRSVSTALALHDEIVRHSVLKFQGLMLYEAQVAGLADQSPFKKMLNPILRWVRASSRKSVAQFREKLSKAFRERNIQIEIFNGGGSGSLNFTAHEPWVTEVTAGSAFFSPHLFDHFSNIHFEPSCFFALQAVRKSDPGMVTCFGGGYIASGETGKDRNPIPVLPRGLSLISTEGCGEVQTPLKGPSARKIKLGAPIIFRHAKAGELMSHFNEVICVTGGKINSKEKTYRGLGLSI